MFSYDTKACTNMTDDILNNFLLRELFKFQGILKQLFWVGNALAPNKKHIFYLTSKMVINHWGPVTHICVGNLTIIGSDNGLSPGWGQAITWTNVGILLIGPLENKLQWNIHRNSYIFIQEDPFEKCGLKNGGLFCLGLNVLMHHHSSGRHCIKVTDIVW